MNGNDIPRINEHVTARVIGGEVFLMHLPTARTYALNETASFAWMLLDGARTVDGIIAAALEEYDVSGEECRDAIVEALGTLVAEGLVSLATPDA